MAKQAQSKLILSIDIGGSHIKATILNQQGELQMDYEKIPTPKKATPNMVLQAINTLVAGFPQYERVSVGFPGYVRDGIIKTAPNLDNESWNDINLKAILSDQLKKPVRVVNDADMQGLGVISSKGFEIAITLGTGFGTALFNNGKLLPHLELAHHPVFKYSGYDEYIGDAALEKEGEKDWNKRMKKVFKILKTVFNYDYLYIGGGNSSKLTLKLDKNMKLVTNRDGIKGGARLWEQEEEKHPGLSEY